MVARRGWDWLRFVAPTPALARSPQSERRGHLACPLSVFQGSISAPCGYGCGPGRAECADYGSVVAAPAAGWAPRLRRSFSVFRASLIAAFCFSAHEGQMPWLVGVSNSRLRYSSRRTHLDRKSTRLNSSHPSISYAVFCLKKKKKKSFIDKINNKKKKQKKIQH